MVLNVTETVRLIRDGEKGVKWVWRWGEREIIILLTLHCHHQNDSHIKVGNAESPFNALMTVVGKVTRIVSQTHNFSIVLMLY